MSLVGQRDDDDRGKQNAEGEGAKSRALLFTQFVVDLTVAASLMVGAATAARTDGLNLRDGAGSRWDEVGWTELKLGQLPDYLGSERGLNVSGRQLSGAKIEASCRQGGLASRAK